MASNGWDDPKREKLWRYNQHYFDDLNAIDAPARRAWHQALMQHWLANNPPGEGTAWEPYPTSLRIVNWIKWAQAGNELGQPLRDSLAAQARWLSKRLEWHLLGNHLFANAKALLFAGLWFDGEEAQAWLDEGFRILERESAEQILPDGGQFELSPMYHALALEDLLDLINMTRVFDNALTGEQRRLKERWNALVPLMRRWLSALSHPDGEIAFFNDAAFGIAPPLNELDRYAKDLGFDARAPLPPLTWLSDSGYARLSSTEVALIIDMARIGPDYLPGHAHADTLSFELSAFGQRVFVNSGTSVYGIGPERQRQRGTAAHNTVTVSGRNSSDVWSGFRVGARAKPFDVDVKALGGALVATASHDGYRNLNRAPVHTRRWELTPHALRISDQLSASNDVAEARFHLHPDVQLTQYDASSGKLILKTGDKIFWRTEAGPARIERTSWHPAFGVTLNNECLVLPLARGGAALNLVWAQVT